MTDLRFPAIVALVTLIAFAVPPATRPAVAGNVDDEKAVRQAVLDYVEGIYQVDPSLIERGVKSDLRKLGFWFDKEKGIYRGPREMTYEQLHELAGSWNKEGRVDPKTAVKEIIVYEVLDKTASAKLVAHWGIDYMHLARFDGQWKIINVLWQSPPRTP